MWPFKISETSTSEQAKNAQQMSLTTPTTTEEQVLVSNDEDMNDGPII